MTCVLGVQTRVYAGQARTDAAQAGGRVEGSVWRAGERTRLAGVNVLIYPVDPALKGAGERALAEAAEGAQAPAWLRRALTDEEGAFVVEDLPVGAVVMVEVVAPGYRRARRAVAVAPAVGRPLRLYLRPEGGARYRTTVSSRRTSPSRIASPAPVERALSQEEVRTMPGSQGDPLRALQSLPGVARAPFGAGLLVLRGANPRQSTVFVGDHPVPFAFHLSGLSAVLPAGAIESMEFAPSNFAPAFGNTAGGLVSITPRVGRRDGHHGEASLDLGGVGGLAEGPIGKGSFVVAARRAHLDLPLRAWGALNPWNTTIYPSYYDYQAFYDRPLGGGQRLHVGFLGAGDRLAFKEIAGMDGERRTIFEPRLSFHRVDLAYRAAVGRTSVLVSPALRVDSSRLFFGNIGEDEPVPRRTVVATARAQVEHAVTDSARLILGADAHFGRQTGEEAPVTTEPMGLPPQRPPVVVGAAGTSNTTSMSHGYMGLYGEAIVRLGGATISAGSRASAFVVAGEERFAVDPRLRVSQALGDRVTLSGGVGRYSQPWIGRQDSLVGLSGLIPGSIVLPDQIVENFDPTLARAELGVRVIHALQVSAGASVRLEKFGEIEGVGFVRDVHDPMHRPTEGAPARERAFGGELIVRRRLIGRFYGWVAYTLMWAQREVWSRAEGSSFKPSAYDQRHNLVAVVSARLPRDWQIGGRFRLSSGLPFTPVVGADGGANWFVPRLGEPLSEHFPTFHQLDVRVDKRWLLDRTTVSAYLDVLNVLNTENAEAYVYSVDYRRRLRGISLPILPLLGIRVDL